MKCLLCNLYLTKFNKSLIYHTNMCEHLKLQNSGFQTFYNFSHVLSEMTSNMTLENPLNMKSEMTSEMKLKIKYLKQKNVNLIKAFAEQSFKHVS